VQAATLLLITPNFNEIKHGIFKTEFNRLEVIKSKIPESSEFKISS
jgi:hypothetical protein